MNFEEKFPACKKDDECSWLTNAPGYDEIVAAFGHEVLLTVEYHDYQGDTRYLLKSGDRYGHLNVGWGSCSGCDALQACDSVTDLQALANSIEGDIKWFESAGEALKWFESHDWEGDYSWSLSEQKQYVEKAMALLRGASA